MDRNYRRKYEVLQRLPDVVSIDVSSASPASIKSDEFDMLLFGVFGMPLHPRYPRGFRGPAGLDRISRACLMVEDLREDTYHGGIDALCHFLQEHVGYLVSTYDCPALHEIKRRCPGLRKVFVVPHHVDMAIFRDYAMPKRYDILLYGNIDRPWYPFRKRLHRLIPRFFENVRVIKHPSYAHFDSARCGEALARSINQSRIAIATSSECDYLLAKYVEISACRCLVAGTMATAGLEEWNGRFLQLNDGLSDHEICSRISERLASPQSIADQTDAMYRHVHATRGLDRYASTMTAVFEEIAKDGS